MLAIKTANKPWWDQELKEEHERTVALNVCEAALTDNGHYIMGDEEEGK